MVAPREVQIKRGVRTHVYFVVSILWLLFVLPVKNISDILIKKLYKQMEFPFDITTTSLNPFSD
jgi:hypothetical protein